MHIPFIDIKSQHKEIEKELNSAVNNVIQRGDFILGEDVKLFEQEFAKYCGTKFAIGVNSGTDALFLSLLACGVGKGDEVIVPVFTFIATAFAVSYTGAKPVFVDIEEKTFNIDPEKIEKAVTRKTKAIIPVHLFGQPAELEPILKIARQRKLKVIEDAAQAHGAEYKGKKVGQFGKTGCFSFYPTKNLGGFGDGGMIVTDDEKIYKNLFLLRDCGRKKRYEHATKGYNSRLDTVQAAVLRIKLQKLDRWNALRRKNAQLYNTMLKDAYAVITPHESKDSLHVYHQYAIRVKNRDKIMEFLRKNGVTTAVYYPLPLHLQPAYKELGYKKGDFPVAEEVSRDILSLPMHPGLIKKQVQKIAGLIKEVL
ncbi:MAG: DegT/DnrJ/EryC1/StrS family aminotransferase [Candidatus Omnitrophica bacterium]|nr:DegT/DnrJ/EryC1/StrS family aminotransferase [Candidatus Omnitrophota bacterium]